MTENLRAGELLRTGLSTRTLTELVTETLREHRLFQVMLRQLAPGECYYAARGWTIGGRAFRVAGARPDFASAFVAMLEAAELAMADATPPAAAKPFRAAVVRAQDWRDRPREPSSSDDDEPGDLGPMSQFSEPVRALVGMNEPRAQRALASPTGSGSHGATCGELHACRPATEPAGNFSEED